MNFNIGANMEKGDKVGIPHKEASVFSSPLELSVNKFKETILAKKIDFSVFESVESTKEEIKKYLPKMQMKIMRINEEEVVNEIIKQGIVSLPVVITEKIKEVKKPEEIKTEYVKLEGIKEMDQNDPTIAKQIEQELLVAEIRNLFHSKEDFDIVYEKSKDLTHAPSMEDDNYYYEFFKQNIVTENEVAKDLNELKEIKSNIQKENSSLDEKRAMENETAFKIAEITERAITLAADDWYDGDIEIDTTSEWADIKKGIDDILRLKSSDTNEFLGLGVDVTYNGLYSERYKNKFQKMLGGIANGQKNNVKYFKNHQGQMMKEFIVPKVILFFDSKDVKTLVHYIKHFEEESVRSEFKQNPLKYKILNQIISQCELLQDFADTYGNDISNEYGYFMSLMRKWLAKNKDIIMKMEKHKDPQMNLHLKFLIENFKSKSRL